MKILEVAWNRTKICQLGQGVGGLAVPLLRALSIMQSLWTKYPDLRSGNQTFGYLPSSCLCVHPLFHLRLTRAVSGCGLMYINVGSPHNFGCCFILLVNSRMLDIASMLFLTIMATLESIQGRWQKCRPPMCQSFHFRVASAASLPARRRTSYCEDLDFHVLGVLSVRALWQSLPSSLAGWWRL